MTRTGTIVVFGIRLHDLKQICRSNEELPVIWLALMTLACAGRPASQATDAGHQGAHQYAQVSPLNQVTGLICDGPACSIQTMNGMYALDTLTESVEEAPPSEHDVPNNTTWAINSEPLPLAERWNRQIANTWRSPFCAEIPAPDGGSLRLVRGLTPHTSRVMRVGGKVVVARQAPAPENILYPRVMALHPTGQEAYMIVWPNPELVAFQPNSLETNWRIRLGEAALGLFVSQDGRYLVAELGGTAPEYQLLDYDRGPIATPAELDPIGDEAIHSLHRPPATHTVVVDLAEGQVVARLPGSFIGFATMEQGAVAASSQGVSVIKQPPADDQ